MSSRGVTAACALAAACAAGTAWAAAGGPSGPSEVVFIAQIVALLLVGRLLGEAMLRIGQPAVIGQLIGGILLGPSVLGAIWPDAQHALFPPQPEQKAMIDAVSQLGILMLLLLTGMETDLALVRKVRAAALGISIAGIAVPFSCGYALGQFLPDYLLPSPDHRLITSLFLGTALSISSVKIVALVVRDMGFMRRNLGQIIIASAIIDDTIGWIIIAITFSLAQHGAIDAMSVAKSVIGTLAFLAFSYTIGRRIVFRLIRWTNDAFVSEVPVITAILVIMGAMALTTHLIGVHSVLGAFVAGVLVGESPILTRHIDKELRGLITALFAPVFFGVAGLGTDLTVLANPALLWLMLGVIAIASIGKFLGAFVGGKIGGLSFAESLALACGMNARGSTEVIVASIGLSLGMLSQDLFTVIVAMAVVTTTAMPPTLRWALARLPMGEEERARLEQEEFEARGFVTNLERLLLAVDDSANGRFAARLAGLIAGLRSMPTTVLELKSSAAPDRGHAGRSGEAGVKEGAETAQTSEHEADKAETTNVDVTTRRQDKPTEQAIRSEARKGYDLLVIGVAKTAENGEFDEQVNRLGRGFDGPLAIVDGRGAHLKRPRRSKLNMLVPVTGTEVSRRAAEVALALARASDSPVTALYVSNPGGGPNGPGRRQRGETAILRDVMQMADRYNVPLRTAVRVSASSADAILQEARSGKHNLIVMGVNRRPGDTLFFGEVATAVLAKAEPSILFVSSGQASTAAKAAPPAQGGG